MKQEELEDSVRSWLFRMDAVTEARAIMAQEEELFKGATKALASRLIPPTAKPDEQFFCDAPGGRVLLAYQETRIEFYQNGAERTFYVAKVVELPPSKK